MFNGFDLSTIQDAKFGTTQVNEIWYGQNKIWPTVPHDYSQDYFTIVSLENNNTVKWCQGFTSFSINELTIYASTDNGQTWSAYQSSSNGGITIATLSAGDKLLIKANNPQYQIGGSWFYFNSSANFNVEGNILSLRYGDSFYNQVATTGDNFGRLFYNCLKVISTKNLIITNAIDYYCSEMFSGCEYLTHAPQLPATTLGQSCYAYMFYNCWRLIDAPQLPATTLQRDCYHSMFEECRSLTTTPQLPATSLALSCYAKMFFGCIQLTNVSNLPATILYSGSYSYMFSGCLALTQAPQIDATTLGTDSCEYMFASCTALTQAPTLLATTLAYGCYTGMFADCTSLTQAPDLPATTLSPWCYTYMFYGCRSLNYVKCLATDISATNCTTDWLRNVAASGTFYKDANTTWSSGSNSGIPTGWTVVNI